VPVSWLRGGVDFDGTGRTQPRPPQLAYWETVPYTGNSRSSSAFRRFVPRSTSMVVSSLPEMTVTGILSAMACGSVSCHVAVSREDSVRGLHRATESLASTLSSLSTVLTAPSFRTDLSGGTVLSLILYLYLLRRRPSVEYKMTTQKKNPEFKPNETRYSAAEPTDSVRVSKLRSDIQPKATTRYGPSPSVACSRCWRSSWFRCSSSPATSFGY